MVEDSDSSKGVFLPCGKKLPIKTDLHNEFELDENATVVRSHSSYYKAYRREDDRSAVMLKIFPAESSPDDSFLKEISALVALGEHQNIIALAEYFITPCNDKGVGSSTLQWAICFDCVGGRDLLSIMSKTSMFSEAKSRDIALGILRALSHIHEHGYVHRGVTPEHVFLTDDSAVVLADFASCSKLSDQETLSESLGSPGYVAPELWFGEAHTTKADIFSAGVMLHFILSGKVPFFGSKFLLSTCRVTKSASVRNATLRLELCSRDCESIVEGLVHTDPWHRPTASHALNHDWFSSLKLYEQHQDAMKTSPSCSTDECRVPESPFTSETSSGFYSSETSLESLFRHPLTQLVEQTIYSSSCSASTASTAISSKSAVTPPPMSKKPFFARKRSSFGGLFAVRAKSGEA